jgi:hypothetical protein
MQARPREIGKAGSNTVLSCNNTLQYGTGMRRGMFVSEKTPYGLAVQLDMNTATINIQSDQQYANAC